MRSRRESVAEARCRCGFGETWQLVLVKDSCVAEKGSWQGLDGIADRPLCCECAPRPSEGTPKRWAAPAFIRDIP
jgi:hypothetical protein